MARKTRKKDAQARPRPKERAFKSVAMHVTEARGRDTLHALRTERASSAAESLTATRLHNLDPENAAKRILAHALATSEVMSGVARWELSGLTAFRDFQDPTRLGHPKVMSAYRQMEPDDDYGGVHINSGIHNFAAYNIITAKDDANGFLFKPQDSAAMFYLALTQQLSRQSRFSDSRRAVVLSARSLFRTLPQAAIDQRIRAIEAGFDAAEVAAEVKDAESETGPQSEPDDLPDSLVPRLVHQCPRLDPIGLATRARQSRKQPWISSAPCPPVPSP